MSEIKEQKKIEDYLHLYLGCEMVCHKDFRPNRNERSGKGIGYCILTADLISDIYSNRLEYGTPHFKPILRPLSDMTEKEKSIWLDFDSGTSLIDCIHHEATRTNYLRSIFIDVDGLIESGLAIDATKINQTNQPKNVSK